MGGRLISKFAALLINVALSEVFEDALLFLFLTQRLQKKASFSSKKRLNGLFIAQQVKPDFDPESEQTDPF